MNVKLSDIYDAISSVTEGRRTRRDFKQILADSFNYATKLLADIQNGEYKRRISYRRGEVVNANGKHRITHQPDYHTLILQHIAANKLVPLYTQHDNRVALNCKKGCGLTASDKRGSVAHRIKHIVYDRRELSYCLQIDQRKCYDHIKPKVVRKALKAITDDKELIDFAITLGFVDDKIFPVGTPLSPLLHHIAMLETDKLIRQLTPFAVRYADDCILFFATKQEAQQAKWRIKNLWWYTLGIRAKRGGTLVRPIDVPFDFCGTVYHRNPNRSVTSRDKGYTTIRKATLRRAFINNTPKSYPSYFGIMSKTDSFNILLKLEQVNLTQLTDKIRIERKLDAPNISVKELSEKHIIFVIHDYMIRSDNQGQPNWLKCLISFIDKGTNRRVMREFHGSYQGLVDFHVKAEQQFTKDQMLPMTQMWLINQCGYIYGGSSKMLTEIDDLPEFYL
jgi:hypothetical protein